MAVSTAPDITYLHVSLFLQEAKVTVYDMCPGPVASSIAQDTPMIGNAIVWMMRKVFPSKYVRSPSVTNRMAECVTIHLCFFLNQTLISRYEAALPILRLALDPSYEHIVGEVHHHMVRPQEQHC